MKVSVVQPCILPSWDHYVLTHPRGLAYHLSCFIQAIKQAYGFDTFNMAAVSGSRIKGILALTRMGLPGLPGQLVSSPYCDAAGVLADSPEIEAALLDRGLALARAMRIPRVLIRNTAPFAGIDPELTRHAGKVRMVLTLKLDPDDLLGFLKAKVRSQIKKPMRDGLDFVMGGRELVAPFYKIFCENMRDLGSPPHARQWIRQVVSAYGNRAHIGLVRLPDKTPAAAGIILCHPHTVSIPWASSLRRYNRMNPNMLLYWGFLKFAAGRGFGFFDFGRSTPGEGTFRFKAQWGATPAALHWAEFDPFGPHPDRPLPIEPSGGVSLLRGKAETMFSSLPVPLATVLGPCSRKYISL